MTENVRIFQWKTADPFLIRLTSSRTNLRLGNENKTVRRRARSVADRDEKIKCSWPNFLTKKTRFAINTAHPFCRLTREEEKREERPVFSNYGTGFLNRNSIEKRTFNAASIHQMKHAEANEQRIKQKIFERRFRPN